MKASWTKPAGTVTKHRARVTAIVLTFMSLPDCGNGLWT
jgi:hypothetical protein